MTDTQQTARIESISDSKISCNARITLPNGDPVWIAIHGPERLFSLIGQKIVVKKSKAGLFGKTLFKGTTTNTSQLEKLIHIYGDTSIPDSVKSPALKLFVQVALNAKDANSLAQTLSEGN